MGHNGFDKRISASAAKRIGLLFFVSLFFAVSSFALHALASTSDGTIDSTNRYAYGENAGWLDFGTGGGAVHVTDSALTGYAYSENIGWISLNCSNTSSCGTVNYAVSNDGSGNLSGYAYGENVGWIDFKPSAGGVTIDSSGVFHGSAYGENIGWITFNCADTSSCGTINYTLSTDWRSASVRASGVSVTAPTSGGGGVASGGGSFGLPPTSSSTSTPALFEPTGCPPGYICTPKVTVTTGVTSTTSAVFSRNLTLGSVGDDVKALQEFLNSNGFPLSSTGAGSPGNETNYFGPLTRAALARFQKAHGISPAVGYFGPITRAYIKSHY